MSTGTSPKKRKAQNAGRADSGALFSSEPVPASNPDSNSESKEEFPAGQASGLSLPNREEPVFSSEQNSAELEAQKPAPLQNQAEKTNPGREPLPPDSGQAATSNGPDNPPEESDPVEDALGKFSVQWKNTLGEPEEGPLDVLWELIESYKVDIFDVSLMRITEDFLQFVQAAEDLQIELASSFAVMASRLLFYKSKALLPDPGFEEDEEEPGLPPELVQQLLEHRKFQKAAERLRQREEIASGILPREKVLLPENIAEDGEWLDVSLVDLIAAYSRLLQRIEKENDPEKKYTVELEEFSVEDKMQFLRELLEKEPSFVFEDAFPKERPLGRGELVATFLALLELTKQGEIIIRQKVNFGEIRVFKKTVVVR